MNHSTVDSGAEAEVDSPKQQAEDGEQRTFLFAGPFRGNSQDENCESYKHVHMLYYVHVSMADRKHTRSTYQFTIDYLM